LARADLDDDCGKDLKGGAQSYARRESACLIKMIMQTPIDKQTK